MIALAFVLGLFSLGLVRADVSHLRGSHRYQPAFASNNEQFSGQQSESFAPQSYNFGRIQQQSSVCSSSNSACVTPKLCLNGFIDQSVAHNILRSSSGKCFAPEICCQIQQRKSAYYTQDNSVSAAESTSEILTKEGYVVKKPSNQYLPSLPEFNPAPSNDQETFIRPSTSRPTQPTFRPQPTTTQYRPLLTQPPTQRPYQPQPSENRPVQYDPAPIVIPVGCSAAMNCTNIQFCTAAGVISKTPVVLTPDQELFRVPLTDCREPITKEIGKCCRDPDYVDPWPVGRTGAYVAEELNSVFDSGSYMPEPSITQPVRVKAQEGYVLPQPSNNQPRLYLPPNSNRV